MPSVYGRIGGVACLFGFIGLMFGYADLVAGTLVKHTEAGYPPISIAGFCFMFVIILGFGLLDTAVVYFLTSVSALVLSIVGFTVDIYGHPFAALVLFTVALMMICTNFGFAINKGFVANW
jgi:hypothetical protein